VGIACSPRNFPRQASETGLRTAWINIFYAWTCRNLTGRGKLELLHK
jgi:hypothetical protein